MADRKLRQDTLVTFRAGVLKVSQQPTTLRDQSQKTPARGMILAMSFKVLRELQDTSAQQCDLYFGRACVGFVNLVPNNNLPLCFSRQCHLKGYYSCSSLLLASISCECNTSARVRTCKKHTTPAKRVLHHCSRYHPTNGKYQVTAAPPHHHRHTTRLTLIHPGRTLQL